MQSNKKIVADLRADIKADTEYLTRLYLNNKDRSETQEETIQTLAEEFEITQQLIEHKKAMLRTLTGRDMIDE